MSPELGRDIRNVREEENVINVISQRNDEQENVMNVIKNGPGISSRHSETYVLWCRLLGRLKVVFINFVSIFGKIGSIVGWENQQKVRRCCFLCLVYWFGRRCGQFRPLGWAGWAGWLALG